MSKRGAHPPKAIKERDFPRTLDDLPEILTTADVIAYLRGVYGRNAVYDLLNAQEIRNRRHGQKFLIPRTALREFIEC